MKENSFYIFKVSAIVALGGFLLGFDASVISGVVKFIEPQFNLSKLQLGWAVSSITLTAATAMLLVGPLSQKYGRRSLLKIAALLFTISAIGSALAPTFFWLIVFRMLGGLAVGVALVIAPIYIAEVAPPEKRGQLVSFNQLNIVIGISLAFFTNYLILKFGNSDAAWAKSIGLGVHNWRWMLGLETLPAIAYFLGLLTVPRSPRWLIIHKKMDEALDVLKSFTNEKNAQVQFEEVSLSIEKDIKKKKPQIGDLFKKSLTNILIVALLVGIFQQIVGINAVLFYAPMIFEQTGIGTDSSFVQASLVGLTNLGFTILAMYLIDKLGRKPLLIMGMAGIAICLFLLTYGFYDATYILTPESIANLSSEIPVENIQHLTNQMFQDDLAFKQALIEALGSEQALLHESALVTAGAKMNTTLILVGIIGFVGAFAISLGPVMWVLFSELFPNNIRGFAISFVGLVNLAISFLVQWLFPWELSAFGNTMTFFIFGSFAVLGFVSMWWLVPETKGKSLEEIEALLVKT